MSGGGQGSSVIGGSNLSTPTVAGPDGMQMLGAPQLSSLSPMQSAMGGMMGATGMPGASQYQMTPSYWQQVLQQLAQRNQPQQSAQPSQGQSGSLTGAAGNVMGLLGLL